MTELDTQNRYHSQSIIEQLRYWVPGVNDVARVYEVEEVEGWRLFVLPSVAGAAPVEVLLRNDGLFDIEIAQERYNGCALTSRDMLVQLLDSIAAGRVLRRTWVNISTGAAQGNETVVPLSDGVVWRRGDVGFAALEFMATVDRHFLPYRR